MPHKTGVVHGLQWPAEWPLSFVNPEEHDLGSRQARVSVGTLQPTFSFILPGPERFPADPATVTTGTTTPRFTTIAPRRFNGRRRTIQIPTTRPTLRAVSPIHIAPEPARLAPQTAVAQFTPHVPITPVQPEYELETTEGEVTFDPAVDSFVLCPDSPPRVVGSGALLLFAFSTATAVDGTLIHPRLVEGGGVAYLKQLAFVINDVRLRTNSDDSLDLGGTAGPHLTNEWEESDVAITLQHGDNIVQIGGPRSSDARFADHFEPYDWQLLPAARTRLVAWLNAIEWTSENCGVRITLDDGIRPPVEFNAIRYDTELATTEPAFSTVGPFSPTPEAAPVTIPTQTPTIGRIDPTALPSTQPNIQLTTETPTVGQINPSTARPNHQSLGTGTLVPTLSSIPPALIQGNVANFAVGAPQANFTTINPVPISPNQPGVGVATQSDVDPLGPTNVAPTEAPVDIDGAQPTVATVTAGGVLPDQPNPFPATPISRVSTLGPFNTRPRLNQNRIQIATPEAAFTVLPPNNVNPSLTSVQVGTTSPTFGTLAPGNIDITKPPADFGTTRPTITRLMPANLQPPAPRVAIATTQPTITTITGTRFNARRRQIQMGVTSPTIGTSLPSVITPNAANLGFAATESRVRRINPRRINPRINRNNRMRLATVEPTISTITAGRLIPARSPIAIPTLQPTIGTLGPTPATPVQPDAAFPATSPTISRLLARALVPAHPGIRIGTTSPAIGMITPGRVDANDPRVRIPATQPTFTVIQPSHVGPSTPDASFTATATVGTLAPAAATPPNAAVGLPSLSPTIGTIAPSATNPIRPRVTVGTLRPTLTRIAPVPSTPNHPAVQVQSLAATIGTIAPTHSAPAQPNVGMGTTQPTMTFIRARVVAPNVPDVDIEQARQPNIRGLLQNVRPRTNRNRIRVATPEPTLSALEPGDLNAELAPIQVGNLQPPIRPLHPSLTMPPNPDVGVPTLQPTLSTVGPFNTAPPQPDVGVPTVQPQFTIIQPHAITPRIPQTQIDTVQPTIGILRPGGTRPTPAQIQIATLQARIRTINPSRITPQIPDADFGTETPRIGILSGTPARPALPNVGLPTLQPTLSALPARVTPPTAAPIEFVSVTPTLAPLGPVAVAPVTAPVDLEGGDVTVALNGPFNVAVPALPEPFVQPVMPTIGLSGPFPTTPADNPVTVGTLSPTFKLRTTEVASCSFDIFPTNKGSNFLIFGVSVRPLTGYQICGDLVEGGGDAYLKRLEFFTEDRIAVLQTHATDDASENGAEPGPHLTDKWEKSDTAIVLTFGNKTWTLSGPNTGTGPDATEPYTWRMSQQQATDLNTFLNGLSQSSEITVLFDDGPDPVPPVQPAVEMPTLEPVIAHIPTQVTRPRTARNRINVGTTEPTIQVSIPVGITLLPGMQLTAPEVPTRAVGPTIVSPTRPNVEMPTESPPIEPMIFIHFNANLAEVAPVGRRTNLTTPEPEPVVARQAPMRLPTVTPTFHHIIPTFAIAPPPRPLHNYVSITAWLRSFPSHELVTNLSGWIDLTWDTRWQEAGRARLVFEERAIDRDLLNTIVGGSHAVELVIHTSPIQRLYGVINMVTLNRSVADEKFNTNPVTHLTVADNYRAASNTQARVLVPGPAPLDNYRRRDAIEFDPDLDTAAKKRAWGEQELKRTADLHTTQIKSTLRTLQEPAKVVLDITDIFGAFKDRWVIPQGDNTLFESPTPAGEYVETLLNSYVATPFNMSVTCIDQGNDITEPLRYKNLLNAVAQAARYGDVGVEVAFDHTNESLAATIHCGRDRRTGDAFTTLSDRLDRQTLRVGDIANRPIWNDPEDADPMLVQTLQTIGIKLQAGIAKPTKIDPEYRVLNT